MFCLSSHSEDETTLFVGDLAGDVTEALLYSSFQKIGPLSSVSVCRHKFTKCSLGYGFVSYSYPSDAERAIDILNGTSIHNKKITVGWKDDKTDFPDQNVGNIIVKQIDSTVDNDKLLEMFSKFGSAVSVKVQTGFPTSSSSSSSGKAAVAVVEGGKPSANVIKPVGFVHFQTDEDAKAAVAAMNGTSFGETTLIVELFLSLDEQIAQNQTEYTNLEIKNLKNGVTEDVMKESFSTFGDIKRLKIIEVNEKTSAFIDFGDHASAQKAFDEMNGKVVETLCDGETPLIVQRSLSKAERNSLRGNRNDNRSDNNAGSLYVGNLSENVNDDSLKEHFSKYGELSRSQVMFSQFGEHRPRGFGFVCFKDPTNAETAMQELNDTFLDGKRLVVNHAQHRQSGERGERGTPLWGRDNNYDNGPSTSMMMPRGGGGGGVPMYGYGMPQSEMNTATPYYYPQQQQQQQGFFPPSYSGGPFYGQQQQQGGMGYPWQGMAPPMMMMQRPGAYQQHQQHAYRQAMNPQQQQQRNF